MVTIDQVIKPTFIFLAILLLDACSTNPSMPVAQHSQLDRVSACKIFYGFFDHKVDQEQIRDVQAYQLKHYPFLSVNRLLVSFKDELNTASKTDFWLNQAKNLNLQARNIEWNNLSTTSKTQISRNFLNNSSFEQQTTICSKTFLKKLSIDDQQAIRKESHVPDDYSLLMRILGLYPLTSLFVNHQIEKHQAEVRKTFNTPLKILKVNGILQRYLAKPTTLKYPGLVETKNPLGFPVLTTSELNDLFNRYAPTLEIDEVSTADQVGSILLDKQGNIQVNTYKPLVYVMPSYTRMNHQILLQLNYSFWFPERPPETDGDVYAGKLDGIIWRVTLNRNLKPLIFDSVHNCGCYHKYYVTNQLKINSQAVNAEREVPFVAQQNLKIKPHISWVLRISSKEHYIERIYQDNSVDENAKIYQLANYSRLRSLSNGTISKSLFNDKGIVLSSVRKERFLLWPMGIPYAGAMRQWGHHATAFVGKRYFDDPFLLNKFFIQAK